MHGSIAKRGSAWVTKVRIKYEEFVKAAIPYLYKFHIVSTLGFYDAVLQLKHERKQKMKKILLVLLTVIVILGVLAGAGFTGYRIGYTQGTLASSDGAARVAPWNRDWNQQVMPMHNFGRDFGRGFGPGGYAMMGRDGMGFFSPFTFLGRILFLALIIWFAYWLFTKSGWKFSLTRQQAESSNGEPGAKQD